MDVCLLGLVRAKEFIIAASFAGLVLSWWGSDGLAFARLQIENGNLARPNKRLLAVMFPSQVFEQIA